MHRAWLSLILLLTLPAFGQAIYKCPGPDGKSFYQQTPCPQGARMSIQDNGSSSAAESVEPATPAAPVAPSSGLREGEKAMLENARVRDEAAAQRAHEQALQSERAAVAREAIQAERDRINQIRALHCARYPNSSACR